VIRLLEKGEHRLLRAVEGGQIPVSTAVEIAEADDIGVQQALQQAYEQNLLRGRKLLIAKRVIEQRRRRGKGLRTTGAKGKSTLSSDELLRAYRQETDKKRLLIRKAETTRGRLVFVTEALRNLLADEHFVTLLRAEGLDTLPRPLADRFRASGQT
jgi:ParB family chromosome partitioning protein